MKKLFAISVTLVLAMVFVSQGDCDQGSRHQHQYVVQKDFAHVDLVSVSRGTLNKSALPSGEVGHMILNPETVTWRMPVFNNPYRYRSQKWIRDNNISVKPTNSVQHDLTQGRFNPVKLC